MGKEDEIEEEKPVVSWHALDVSECIETLKLTDDLLTNGLTTAEAAERLAEYGPNKMTEAKKTTLLELIWKQVANVLVAILVTVAIVSAVRAATATDNEDITTNWIQVGLIVGVITVNTWIGIVQEGSAEKAAEALKNMLSSDAQVIRNGTKVMVPAQDVVPGDVVVLSLGDRIPADLRMFEVANLAGQEAMLTGESVPIDKQTEKIDIAEGMNPQQTPLGDRRNMCFSATLVAQGSGTGIAVTTGDDTEIGTINALVSKVKKKKTNVLKQIDTVSKWLAFFISITALITFLVAKFKTGMAAIEAVSTALVCAVAMIPEGLEAIVTLTYAWAVSNMAKNNAIIRALPAVETLGSVTVICSDKTGTLTQNVMSLTAFITSNARYRNDVNSTDRVNTNFVRDDGFMAERANHQLQRTVSQVIKDGPGTDEPRRGHAAASNHFAIQSLHTPADSEDAGEVAEKVSDSVPVAEGESPSTEWINAALTGGVLCSKCVLGENGSRKGEIGNPTELSILRASYFCGIDIEQLKKDAPVVAEVPFSSEYKFMATVHAPTEADGPGLDGKYVVHAKGAPDRMVNYCAYQAKAGLLGEEYREPIDKNYWIEQIAILSSHGLRVLALCRAEIPKDSISPGDQLGPEFVNENEKGPWLTLVGLCAIMDPPRAECVQAIKEAHGAGVRVAMITGDHKDTAVAIGHMLGIVDETYTDALTGPELDEMSDDDLRQAVMTHNVFARASPQNKIRIVKALQAEGQVSGMTGDGVNDAPALRAADMGVAMGKEGTDVAREAAEMILADDNFATIVTAVREGRVVWDNLRKVLLVNTPINNAQGLGVLFGLICGLKEAPLSPIQVLYSNLICAITLGFVCAIEPAEEGIMTMPPRRVGKRLIGRYLFLRIAIGTICLVAAVVGSVFWAKSLGYNQKQMRAQAFNVLDFGAISVTLSARFAYNSSYHKRIFVGNDYCWYSVAVVAVLQVALTYIPGLNTAVFSMSGMAGPQWGIVALFMVVMFIVMEAEKAVRRNLKMKGKDTDDQEKWVFDEDGNPAEPEGPLVPKGASHLNLAELSK
uniref:P-type sodium-transporting ATPase4 n=1 Tax=Helicotheca tamesis TaxID=374047 RepID=A0A7S2IHA3_9STRA